MAKSKETLLRKLSRTLLNFDQLGETASFSVDGNGSYPSILGAVLTFCVCIICLDYGYTKYITMKEFGSTTFQVTSEDFDSHAYEDLINYELTKLNVAFVM